jgi:hypothetical protein
MEGLVGHAVSAGPRCANGSRHAPPDLPEAVDVHRYPGLQQAADGGLKNQGVPPQPVDGLNLEGVARPDGAHYLAESGRACGHDAHVRELLAEVPAYRGSLDLDAPFPGADHVVGDPHV